jgi:hypothetical protein
VETVKTMVKRYCRLTQRGALQPLLSAYITLATSLHALSDRGASRGPAAVHVSGHQPSLHLRAIISLCLSQTAAAAGHQPAAEGGDRRRAAACLTAVVKAGAWQRSQTAQIVLCYLRRTRFTLPDCGQRARLRAVAPFTPPSALILAQDVVHVALGTVRMRFGTIQHRECPACGCTT